MSKEGGGMKKYLLFLSLCCTVFLSGCVIRTQTEYVVDESTKQEIYQQVVEELKNEFIINYHNPSLAEIENMIIDVVDQYGKAFIGVSNYRVNSTLFGIQEVLQGTGSGVIYDYDEENHFYYAITNAHVVDGADKVKVVFENGETVYTEPIYQGKFYVADLVTDIAVIKFAYHEPLKVVQFADSDQLRRGQLAIAIGNPLGYDYFGSVTFGVVSGLSRGVDIDYNNDQIIDWKATLIQHDVAISPGNSGGPLFDLNGRLIGINNMKIVDSDVSNIGFAIPSNTVLEIATILRTNGKVSRPYLGFVGQVVTNPIKGIYITDISSPSSLTGTGVRVGDIITAFNGQKVESFDDLTSYLSQCRVGDKIDLTIYRQGRTYTYKITLAERP